MKDAVSVVKTVVALVVIAAALFLAGYIGLWLLFVGGIVQIVEAIKASPVSGLGIGIGLLRVVCSSITPFLFYFGGGVAVLLVKKWI